MKKLAVLISLSLILAAMASLVACKNNKDSKATSEEKTNAPTEIPTEEPIPPTVYETQTLKVAEHLDDVFRILGRAYTKSDNKFYMDFSCSGIHFVADCSGKVQIQIFCDKDRNNRFTVYVDGVRSETEPFVNKDNSGSYLTIASDLEPGVHDFRIVNQTQFIWSQAAFGSVEITGEFREKPAERELFLEFYGDSILNGSNVRMGGSSTLTTDATQAFGWLTAELLNADMSLIGCGNLGLTKNKRDFLMKDLIEWSGAHCTSYKADSTVKLDTTDIPKYDFARIPDAVIIEQGVNDKDNASTAAFKTALTEMINTLREKYGKDVPIVLLTGYTTNAVTSDAYNTAIPAIIAELGGESKNLYVCKLSDAAASTAIGGDGVHPNVETSKVMAQELAAYLETVLKK